MGRWARSKELAGASWSMLRQDKELLVLPLVSGLASLAIAATFAVPIFVTSTSDVGGDLTMEPNALTYALSFVMYLVLAYVAIFFKTALICGANERMQGGNPSVVSSLAGAAGHARRILPWAIVTATVSVILRSLEERAGFLGRIVIGFVGMAWAAVTFLVLPVLVFEQVGVGDAIRRSTDLLKRTWGENLIVNIGIGLLTFVLILPAIVVVIAGAATGTALGLGTTLVLAVVWIIAVSCWSSAMTAVFQLALYRYATQSPLPAAFAAAHLDDAFGPKEGRSMLGS